MNIRKNIDYSEMYAAIDDVMEKNNSQMELYCSIGQAVAARSEKGAAVMAAEYIASRYPDARGFSPRNLRRMRDFYRTYENHPSLLSLSMELGWTQNVVIMEADLTMDLRAWYLRAVAQLGWSKAELIGKIADSAHEKIVLDIEQEACDNVNIAKHSKLIEAAVKYGLYINTSCIKLRRCRGKPERGGIPWHTMCSPMFMGKRIVFMRC